MTNEEKFKVEIPLDSPSSLGNLTIKSDKIEQEFDYLGWIHSVVYILVVCVFFVFYGASKGSCDLADFLFQDMPNHYLNLSNKELDLWAFFCTFEVIMLSTRYVVSKPIKLPQYIFNYKITDLTNMGLDLDLIERFYSRLMLLYQLYNIFMEDLYFFIFTWAIVIIGSHCFC